MKKTLCMATLGLSIFASNFAAAQNSTAVFAGASFAPNTGYGYVGGVMALNGNIDSSGVLARVSGAYGAYEYRADVPTGHVNGDFSTADVMAGYQGYAENVHAAIYVGVTHEDHDLDQNDIANSVDGGEFGAKAQVEFEVKLADKMSLENNSNFSTPYDSYWTQTYLGFNCAKLSVGPEIALLGNDEFDQQRYGVRVQNVKFMDRFEGYLGTGYARTNGDHGTSGSDNGLYVATGIAAKF